MAVIEQVSQNVVTVPAAWSLGEAYGKLSGKAFYVEPLSAKVPLADFIAGGGLGWGSLRHGTFASKLYKVQTDKFTFGSNYSTSVNAGYPLHRLVEGMPHGLCPEPDAKLESLTVPVRPAPKAKVLFRACALADAAVPAAAANFIWVNAAAASALGLSGAGSAAFFEEYEPEGEGEPVEGVFEKRFFEDAIPQGYSLLKLLSVKSNLGRLEELAKQSGRFFVCMWTHLGVLVCVSGQQEALAKLEKEALKLRMTFALPKKGGEPRMVAGAFAPAQPETKPAGEPEKKEPPKPEPPKAAPAQDTAKPEAPAEAKQPERPEAVQPQDEKKQPEEAEKKDAPAPQEGGGQPESPAAEDKGSTTSA